MASLNSTVIAVFFFYFSHSDYSVTSVQPPELFVLGFDFGQRCAVIFTDLDVFCLMQARKGPEIFQQFPCKKSVY